jgi:pantoate--beta-alanine ligase
MTATAAKSAASEIIVAKTIADVRQTVQAWRQNKLTVGFVPTMGALHIGHLSLVEQAKKKCDRVVVSIFVNPTQFNRPDDLARYPRPIDQDIMLCQKSGVDLAFCPNETEIYPNGNSTKVHVDGVTAPWEGDFRPGHFDGVSTVVSKLFHIVGATHAFFGEKDYQQLQMIRTMVRDLNMPIEIVPCATIREDDGLAFSSRNLLLEPGHRAVAPAMYRILTAAAGRMRQGDNPASITADAISELRAAGFDKVDYIGICDAATLAPLQQPAAHGRILAAAWLGGVRLIDNIAIEG